MTDIFISYSHQDEVWKDALQKQLRVLEQQGELTIWEDRQIKPGADWLPEIKQAIAKAKVVILLVSSDFLISEFVLREEIPEFLKRRKVDGLRIIPVLVRPCVWQAVPWLAELQGATKDNQPLSRFSDRPHDLEAAVTDVVAKVFFALQEARKAEIERLEAEQQAEQEQQQRLAEQQAQAEQREQEARAQALREEQQRLQRAAEEKAQQEQREREALAAQQQAEAEAKRKREAEQAEQQRQAELQREREAAERRQQAEWALQQQRIKERQARMRGYVRNGLKVSKPVALVGLALAAVAGVVSWWPPGEVADTPEVASQQSVPAAETPPADENLPFEPKVVFIQGGTFTMGCVEGRDDVEGGCYGNEKPPHEVTVDDFWLAETEVTVGQYLACVEDGGCPEPEWREEGSQYNVKTGSEDHYEKLGDALTGANYPIVGVSWNNAVSYTKWLSEKTGKNYQLPSEAQWEYAARAGSDTAFPWGQAIGKGKANCSGDLCGEEFTYTSPVKSFPANGGLYDMHGNVWEWVQDRWHGNYQGAPVKGEAWEAGDSPYRVFRGGSWNYRPWNLRSANRNRFEPDDRSSDLGFRPALVK